MSPTCPSLAAWDQWLERCAVRLCEAEHAAEFEAFARVRLRIAAGKEFGHLANRILQGRFDSTPAEPYPCFNFFEIYARTRPLGAALRRADPDRVLNKERLRKVRINPRDREPEREVCHYAGSFFRPAIREAFQKEQPRHGESSLDDPVPERDGLTRGDMLTGASLHPHAPGAASPLAPGLSAEIQALVAEMIEALDDRQRLGVWARLHRISVDHPQLHIHADCGRDAIWRAQGAAFSAIAAKFQPWLGELSPEQQEAAMQGLVGGLGERLEAWAESENLRNEDF